MSDEEAIKILKRIALNEDIDNEDIDYDIREAIGILLNKLRKMNNKIKSLDIEINHWKKGFERELEDNQENTLELLKQDEQLRKKDKIIDLMAGAIDSLDSQLVICKYKNKEDVKKQFEEYFERKIKDE